MVIGGAVGAKEGDFRRGECGCVTGEELDMTGAGNSTRVRGESRLLDWAVGSK